MAEQIVAYERVADGDACEFCETVEGAVVKSDEPMPLHAGCGCGTIPITGDAPPPDARTHGEMMGAASEGRLAPPVPTIDPDTLPRQATTPFYSDAEGIETAIAVYRGQQYKTVNGALREEGNLGDLLNPGNVPGQVAQRTIANLDSAFRQVAAPGGAVRLYRGLNAALEDLFPQLRGGDLVGKVITEPAYSSTTASRKIAEGVFGSGDLLELTVLPTVKALRLEGGFVADSAAREILLERDVDYVITGVRREGGRRIVEMTVRR